MKIWITTDDNTSSGRRAQINWKKPSEWDGTYQCYYSDARSFLPRDKLRRILRGSGKRLPKHGSKQIVEVDLIAK